MMSCGVVAQINLQFDRAVWPSTKIVSQNTLMGFASGCAAYTSE
jgi:hypothetical protein